MPNPETETRPLRYIESTLVDNESIVVAPKQSRWDYLPTAIVSVLTMLITSPFLLYLWLVRWTTEQALTSNNRIVVKTGFIWRSTDQMSKDALETICVDQSLFGRIFGYGDIVFKGKGSHELRWRVVKDVVAVNKVLNSHLMGS